MFWSYRFPESCTFSRSTYTQSSVLGLYVVELECSTDRHILIEKNSGNSQGLLIRNRKSFSPTSKVFAHHKNVLVSISRFWKRPNDVHCDTLSRITDFARNQWCAWFISGTIPPATHLAVSTQTFNVLAKTTPKESLSHSFDHFVTLR